MWWGEWWRWVWVLIIKMEQNLECPLCNIEVFTGLGQGCKMCGMVLETTESKIRGFCSNKCETLYEQINN